MDNRAGILGKEAADSQPNPCLISPTAERRAMSTYEISCNCFAECTPGHFQATCVVISICNLISRQLLNRMRCALS